MKIGVLNLQGAVSEHVDLLEQCQVSAKLVKQAADFNDINGLIIPGGESTVIKKLLIRENMLDPLQNLVKEGLPVFGTCAGLVLLGQKETLNGFDGEVVRNGFGRQKESFESDLPIKGWDNPFHCVFIRAPYLSSVGPDVNVLAAIDQKIVAIQTPTILATAFHPELTLDSRFHQLFIQQARAVGETVTDVDKLVKSPS